MAYSGYLITLGGVTLPNSFIDRTSWTITPLQRRVVESFYDVSGLYHEYLAEHQRTKIQFKIREHTEAEHTTLLTYLQDRYQVSATYFNDLTQEYRSGVFRLEDPVFRHKKTFDGQIWYSDTQITLTEY